LQQPSNVKMELIRPGSVKTQTFSAPEARPADEYVREVLEELGTV